MLKIKSTSASLRRSLKCHSGPVYCCHSLARGHCRHFWMLSHGHIAGIGGISQFIATHLYAAPTCASSWLWRGPRGGPNLNELASGSNGEASLLYWMRRVKYLWTVSNSSSHCFINNKSIWNASLYSGVGVVKRRDQTCSTGLLINRRAIGVE